MASDPTLYSSLQGWRWLSRNANEHASSGRFAVEWMRVNQNDPSRDSPRGVESS